MWLGFKVNWEKSCISTPNSLACIWLLPVRTLPICLLPVMARINSSSLCLWAFSSFLLEKVRRMQLLMAFFFFKAHAYYSHHFTAAFCGKFGGCCAIAASRLGTGHPGSLTGCQFRSKYGLSLLPQWKCNPYSCTATVCWKEYFQQFLFNFTLTQALLRRFPSRLFLEMKSFSNWHQSLPKKNKKIKNEQFRPEFFLALFYGSTHCACAGH